MSGPTIPPTGVCDLTTTGRRSGRPRTVEIWYVTHDDALHIVGTPGARDWLANLRADPRAHLRLHHPRVEFDCAATEVTDETERLRVTRTAWTQQPWYAAQGHSPAEWVAGAPMVRLRTPDGPIPGPWRCTIVEQGSSSAHAHDHRIPPYP